MADPSESTADLRRARDRLSQLRQANAEARRELDRRDAEIETAINALDAVISLAQPPDAGADLYVPGPDGQPVAVQLKTHREPRNSPTSVRSAIARLLSSERRPFETAEIVQRVAEFGAVEVQAATTRSILAKMHRSGEIEQIKRGLYRARRTASSMAVEESPVFRQTAGARVWGPAEPEILAALREHAEGFDQSERSASRDSSPEILVDLFEHADREGASP
jgi:hypothetical protein